MVKVKDYFLTFFSVAVNPRGFLNKVPEEDPVEGWNMLYQ